MKYDNRSEIIELVELDQRLAQLSQEQIELGSKRVHLEDEKAQVVDEVTQADKKVYGLKIKIDGLELELKSIEQKQGRTKEKLLTVGSQKELDSLRHEEESLVKQREELDEQGLELLLDLETSQEEAAYKKAELPKKEQVIQTELDEVIDRSAHIKKLIAAYTQDRIKLVAGVPDEFIQTYDTMLQKLANPVVPVIKDACSGCFSGLRSSEKAHARAGEFVPCQGCYRLMYLFKLDNDDEQ